MGVGFRFMAGVTMLVGPMLSWVVMMMIDGGAATMSMVVIVLMGMIVTMVMDVFVAVFHVPMRMLMGVLMHVFVVMQMIVFVFSFHHQSSCTAGGCSLSSDSHTACFKYFGAVCQRINRLTRNFEARFCSLYRFDFPGWPL